MPIVTVQQSPRDLERKRALVAGITQAFVDAYDIPPEHVQVFIHEVGPRELGESGEARGGPRSVTSPQRR